MRPIWLIAVEFRSGWLRCTPQAAEAMDALHSFDSLSQILPPNDSMELALELYNESRRWTAPQASSLRAELIEQITSEAVRRGLRKK